MNPSCVKFSAGKRKQYKRFIKMCTKAKEIQDSHALEKGDCFYYPLEGIQEVLIIRDDRITATPDKEVDCLISECVWLQTESQVKEMAGELNLTLEGLEDFLEDPTIIKPNPGTFFRTSEDQWLAYYMLEQYKKI